MGGILIENFSEVKGRKTLPALDACGSPSAPTIDSAGFQVRLRTPSRRSLVEGCISSFQGNSSTTPLPRIDIIFSVS